MKKIKILCDSMSDLPVIISENENIDIIPVTIIHEGKEYKAGVNLTTEEYYKLLRNTDTIPSTSQITYVTYKEIFDKYVEEGYAVLYICGSSVGSGTYQSATLAKNDVDGEVYLFDTYSFSIGGGMLVKEALDMVERGLGIEEIMEKLEEYKKNTHVLFSVSSLENLCKGGRISGTKAAIGGLLNIKPILSIQDGLVKQKTQVRGLKKVIPTLVDLMKNEVGEDFTNKDIFIGCADDFEQRDKLAEYVKKELAPRNIYTFEIGPCVGTHSGPTVLGIGCLDK